MVADVTGALSSPLPAATRHPARRGNRSWLATLALAFAVHLGLLYLASLSLHGPREAGRELPPLPSMSIGLIGPLAGSPSAAPTPAPTDPSAQAPSDQSVAPDPEGPTALSEPEQAAQSGATGDGADSGGGSDSIDDPRARASVAAAAAPLDETAAQLWLQISRCWNAQPTRIPLTLTLTLDARGALVGEPAPLRTAGVRPSEETLAAEALAARAVKACAPYTLKTDAALVHQVHFTGDPSRTAVRSAEPTGL